MKKRTLLAVTVAFALSFTFNSCKDKETTILPPMLGYWKCTGVGGNVFGASTTPMGEDYLKYFSISYAGMGTSGYFARVGVSDISELATISKIDLSIWKNFLSAGSYTYDANAGTVTHVSSSDGESKTYSYVLSNDGNTLKLIEHNINVPSSSTVNNALEILNILLNTNATTSVGVEYTYEKMSGQDAFNALSSLGK